MDIDLFPWQRQALNVKNPINWLHDTLGGTGKGILGGYTELLGFGIWMPRVESVQELQQALYTICTTEKRRDVSHIFLYDFECDPDHLIATLRRISHGTLFDSKKPDRLWTIQPPRIWIYSKRAPDKIGPHWKVWTIQPQPERIPLAPQLHLKAVKAVPLKPLP
jgi:hypothetical protein